MALRNLFNVASKAKLPDLGISEKFGYTTRPQQVFQVGAGLSPQQTSDAQSKVAQYSSNQTLAPNQSFLPTQPFSNTPIRSDLGSSSAGATGAPSGAFSAGGGGGVVAGDIDDAPYRDEQARLDKEFMGRKDLAVQQAARIFDPLAQNFDTQLGRLSSELGELRGGVEAGAAAGRNLVGTQLEGVLGTLGQQETGVKEQTQKSLRNLAEDQRNTTTSVARQLGARGAGDTSAGDYAGAAIGRQGLKQRGSALESQAQGIREIEGRRVEAQNIANQEVQRIEQAKQQQLTSLASDFQRIQRELENAKSMATSDERRFIAEQQNQLRDQLSQRLSELENESRQRKAALQDWGQKQEIEMQNSLRRMIQGGRYDATNVLGNIGKAANLIGNTNLSPQGRDFITEQYGVPSGLFDFSPGLDDRKKELEIRQLEQELAQEEALLGGAQQSQGFIPDSVPLIGRF